MRMRCCLTLPPGAIAGLFLSGLICRRYPFPLEPDGDDEDGEQVEFATDNEDAEPLPDEWLEWEDDEPLDDLPPPEWWEDSDTMDQLQQHSGTGGAR